MAKRQTKAIIKPFASEEINPDFLPSPIGQWAGNGAVTPSLDPEVLLENASQGITKMCVQQDGQIILPPAGDMSAIQYSNDFRITALQEHGIAEYSPILDYHLNDITKAPSGSKIYRSLVNNNIGNPLTDITKWEELDLLALKQATTSQRGTLQIATTSDINAGTDNTKALTIANLRNSNINFTGTPTAPTQATSDNSTKIATTEYVNNKIASEKKFGIDVAGKISFLWNVVFIAPNNGSIKIVATVNDGGSFNVLIDGIVAWTDASNLSQKIYNYVIPIAKNQTFSINKNSLVTFIPLLFFPYKF